MEPQRHKPVIDYISVLFLIYHLLVFQGLQRDLDAAGHRKGPVSSPTRPNAKKVTGGPGTRSPFQLYANMLFEDGCDARKGLAFESLEHCAAAGTYVTYLVSKAHLRNGCD